MLYFLPFFIMHFSTFILIPPDADPELAVARALAPFDENLQVAPHRLYPDDDHIRRMAEHYQLDPSDLHALAKKMRNWDGNAGGVDARGLFSLSTMNAAARWDWFAIGGRWDGYIPYSRRNVIRAGTLANAEYLSRCLPYYVLTPDGEWLEHENNGFDADVLTGKKKQPPDRRWLRLVRETLRRWSDHRVVCVDIHS